MFKLWSQRWIRSQRGKKHIFFDTIQDSRKIGGELREGNSNWCQQILLQYIPNLRGTHKVCYKRWETVESENIKAKKNHCGEFLVKVTHEADCINFVIACCY